MARVALLVRYLAEVDAVSNDVLGMYRALSDRGHDVGIFSEHGNNCRPSARPLRQSQRFLRDASALIIYHHSTAWDEGLRVLRKAPCRRVVRYHNVTPPEF